jgi:hypothetical protein
MTTNKPKLIIIDDTQAGIAAANDYGGSVFDIHVSGIGYMKNENAYNQLISWLEAEVAPQGVSDCLGFILDLGFRWPETNPVWQSVRDRMARQDAIGCELPETVWDGFSVLNAIIECKWLKRCVVMVASGRTAEGRGMTIKKFAAKSLKLNKNYGFSDSAGNMAQKLEHRPQLFEDLDSLWKKTYPEISGDSFIENAVSKWLDFRNKLSDSGKAGDFCEHEHIQDNTALYSLLAVDIFALSRETQLTNNELKSLLMLSPGYEQGEKPTDDHSYRRWIASDTWREILQSIFPKLSAEVLCDHVAAPVCPALSFFLALRVLRNKLLSQDPTCQTGILDLSRKIEQRGCDHGYVLSIPLRVNNEMCYELSRRWIWKVEAGGKKITDDGVCAALWNASRAKTVLDASSIEGNKVRELMKLFDGPGRTVAAIGFGPNTVNLFWR